MGISTSSTKSRELDLAFKRLELEERQMQESKALEERRIQEWRESKELEERKLHLKNKKFEYNVMLSRKYDGIFKLLMYYYINFTILISHCFFFFS